MAPRKRGDGPKTSVGVPRDLFDTIAAIKAREGFDSKATVIRKAIVVYQRQMERAEG